jgi:hypothetical protein
LQLLPLLPAQPLVQQQLLLPLLPCRQLLLLLTVLAVGRAGLYLQLTVVRKCLLLQTYPTHPPYHAPAACQVAL